jgi:hypothetical protein
MTSITGLVRIASSQLKFSNIAGSWVGEIA